MPAVQTLQPTLWRTCRVIANRNRLRLFGSLVRQPDQTVTGLARRLRLPVPVASQYLRALEARGLLTVRRVGRYAYYRVSAGETSAAIQPLVAALRRVFQQHENPVEVVFKMATGFTHPRRVAIYRAIKHGTQTIEELQASLRISRFAVVRHLAKLAARRFVRTQDTACATAELEDSVARALATLAEQ
jgi:DNA-binding transcriptional ArsR family regulator